MGTYYINPATGSDADTGASWAHAYKTLQARAWAAGDVINVAKSAESALSGTLSCVQGSKTITTSQDLTGSLAQYSFIRIGSDTQAYMVQAITSTTITLYRNYQGSTGSYSAVSLTLASCNSGDWTINQAGTSGSHITLKFGVNTSTSVQDGVTVFDGGGGNTGLHGNNQSYWDLSRGHFYNFVYPITGTHNSFTYNVLGGHRAGTSSNFVVAIATITALIVEIASLIPASAWASATINSIFSSDPYCVDPVNGNDSNPGTGWGSSLAWKTMKHTFAAGDTIYVAKSAETSATGTVTATNGSVTVSTTNDLTGVIAQYTIIRIGGDNTLYMVKAITASTITLYRPYRGTTGSGKGLTYFTGLPNSASDDWKPTSLVGTTASHITIQGGTDTSNNAQNGFTIIYGNNTTYGMDGTYTFADISRVAMQYFSYLWNANLNDCTLTTCFAFRTGTGAQFAYSCVWARVTGDLVSELGKFSAGCFLLGCTLTVETAESSANGWYASNVVNCVVTWKNASAVSVSYPAINTGVINNLRLIDPIFDELATGGPNIYVAAMFNHVLKDFVIQNPTLGSGTVIQMGNSTYKVAGSIQVSYVGGSATAHRTYIFNFENNQYTLVAYATDQYKTAAPSAKVTFYGSAYPTVVERFYIPCEAGVQKTISVWLRKDSNYGSPVANTCISPTMRLRWMTGSLVSNVDDEAMPDVANTWEQVSKAVTPVAKGTIIMEILMQSAYNGACAWYDDVAVA